MPEQVLGATPLGFGIAMADQPFELSELSRGLRDTQRNKMEDCVNAHGMLMS